MQERSEKENKVCSPCNKSQSYSQSAAGMPTGSKEKYLKKEKNGPSFIVLFGNLLNKFLEYFSYVYKNKYFYLQEGWKSTSDLGDQQVRGDILKM